MRISKEYHSPLIFLGFQVLEMHFEINEDRKNESFDADFDLDVDFRYIELDEEFRGVVYLRASLFEYFARIGTDYPFHFNVILKGVYSASKKNMELELFKNLVQKNGVAILFPYLRSIVCDASKMANISPVLIPSIDVNKFLAGKEQRR